MTCPCLWLIACFAHRRAQTDAGMVSKKIVTPKDQRATKLEENVGKTLVELEVTTKDLQQTSAICTLFPVRLQFHLICLQTVCACTGNRSGWQEGSCNFRSCQTAKTLPENPEVELLSVSRWIVRYLCVCYYSYSSTRVQQARCLPVPAHYPVQKR
jgi:hypothetical protein